MAQKQSLGKGLGAILSAPIEDLNHKPSFMLCGIEELYPNRMQPRKVFDDDTQAQLVSSIRQSGIIQPIVARKTEQGYEIIAGERRWRAAQAAGLHDVPIIIKEANDLEVAELSLIENLQREDLNPVEEAHAYQTLIEQFGLSQEEVALRVGKDRSTIANCIRLLKLPQDIQDSLIKKQISPGHARALLSLRIPADQRRLHQRILELALTVRDVERLIQQQAKPAKKMPPPRRDHYVGELEKALSSRVMTQVKIRRGAKRGTIEITFFNNEDLNRIVGILMGSDEAGGLV